MNRIVALERGNKDTKQTSTTTERETYTNAYLLLYHPWSNRPSDGRGEI